MKQQAHGFFSSLRKVLDDAAIPYTFHRGKVNNLDASRIRKMYGSKVDEWIATRNRLIPREMLSIFTNGFMMQTGLDRIIAFA